MRKFVRIVVNRHVSGEHLNLNGIQIQKPDHISWYKILKKTIYLYMTFIIAGKEAAAPPKIQEPVVSGNPATCQIHPGRETRIEIQKGKSGLGLSIVGGADTLLVGY